MIISLDELQNLTREQLLEKYGQEVMTETREHYEAILQQQSQGSTERPEASDRIFDTTRVEGPDFQMSDIGTAIGNVPASTENVIRGIAELIDVAPEIAEQFTERPWETTKEFGKAIIDPFTSKEKFRKFAVETPTDLAATFAPGVGQAAKASILPRLLQKGLKATTPSGLASGVAGKAARGAEEVGGAITAGLQISTGLPDEAVKAPFTTALNSPGLSGRGAFRAAQKGEIQGGFAGEAFKNALDEIHPDAQVGSKFSDTDLIQVIKESVQKVKGQIVSDFEIASKTSGLAETSSSTALNQIERSLKKNLERFDVEYKIGEVTTKGRGKKAKTALKSLVGSKKADKKSIERLSPSELEQLNNHLDSNLFNQLLPPKGDTKMNKSVTVQELTAARQRLDDGFTALAPKNQAIVSKLKEDLNDIGDTYLGPNSKFPGARKHFAEKNSFLNQVQKAFGTDVAPDKETIAILRNLSSVFNSSNTAKLGLADAMQELTGVPFQALLAGRAMAPLIPKGLVGRQAFIGSLAVGGAILEPATLVFTLPALSVFSPRIVGNFLSAAGVAAKPVRDSIKFMKWLRSKPGVKEIAGEGINIATLTATIMDRAEREQTQQFFKPLRGAQ